MKQRITPQAFKTLLSVLTALTFVFVFMGAGRKDMVAKTRQNQEWVTFSYTPSVPSFAPADVANPANWLVTYGKCQSNTDKYACTVTISAPEDSMTYYTDNVTALSRLKIETSNTDTAYVTGVVDNAYPDAPLEVYIYNGATPYGD